MGVLRRPIPPIRARGVVGQHLDGEDGREQGLGTRAGRQKSFKKSAVLSYGAPGSRGDGGVRIRSIGRLAQSQGLHYPLLKTRFPRHLRGNLNDPTGHLEAGGAEEEVGTRGSGPGGVKDFLGALVQGLGAIREARVGGRKSGGVGEQPPQGDGGFVVRRRGKKFDQGILEVEETGVYQGEDQGRRQPGGGPVEGQHQSSVEAAEVALDLDFSCTNRQERRAGGLVLAHRRVQKRFGSFDAGWLLLLRRGCLLSCRPEGTQDNKSED